MKRFIVLVSALFCMSYAQDVAGSWTLTAVDVYYYNFARPADVSNPTVGTTIFVQDTYGLGANLPLTSIPVGAMFLGVPNGPFGEGGLAQNGVNLNVTLYADQTGMVPVGSTYPDIELDEASCVTFGQVLPVTDDVRYTSNKDSGEILPMTTVVGTESRNPYKGTAMGSLSLSQSVVFSFFPITPTNTWSPVPLFFAAEADDAGAVNAGTTEEPNYIIPATALSPNSDGQFTTVGQTGGWIKTEGFGESIGGPDNPTPELALYWHTIDGYSADTGFGDDGPAALGGTDEDGDGSDFDRIFGLPAISATYIDPTVAAGLGFADFNHLVAGDITVELTGIIQAGCEDQIAAGVAQCDAAGLANFVFGICSQTANGEDFAAACGAPAEMGGGVAAAVTGACIGAGGPATADEAAAVGSPVTCGDLGNSYAAAAAQDGDSSNDCAQAVAYATDAAESNSLCNLAGGIAAGTSTCAETVAGGAADGFVDMDGDGDVGCDDIAAATVAVGTNVTTTDDYTDVALANTIYVMNPDPNFALWNQFVTWNAYMYGETQSNTFLVDDSGIEFDPSSLYFIDLANGSACDPTLGSPTCFPQSDTGGRLVMEYEPTCVPVIESMEVQTEFVGLAAGECTHNGDVDGSNAVNVLDVVALVQYVIGNTTLTDEESCRSDINSDNSVNVLDVVAIVNLIVSARGEVADSVEFKRNNNSLNMFADGIVGAVQMTLSHGDDFIINLTDNAFVAESNTSDNQTVMLVVLPENGELFTASGEFTIDEVIAANAEGYIETSMPASFNLGQAYPNPFNPSTSLDIELSFDSNVSIAVYNVMGQMVSVLHDGNMTSGMHSITWDASNLSSGMYIIKAEVADEVLSQKVMLVK